MSVAITIQDAGKKYQDAAVILNPESMGRIHRVVTI